MWVQHKISNICKLAFTAVQGLNIIWKTKCLLVFCLVISHLMFVFLELSLQTTGFSEVLYNLTGNRKHPEGLNTKWLMLMYPLYLQGNKDGMTLSMQKKCCHTRNNCVKTVSALLLRVTCLQYNIRFSQIFQLFQITLSSSVICHLASNIKCYFSKETAVERSRGNK